jgi:porin
MKKYISIFSGLAAVSLTSYAEVEVIYTSDLASNIDGGLKRGSAYMDILSMAYQSETENGEFLASLLYNNSASFSEDYVGDAQVVSNMDNTHVIRVYEFWYRHDFNEKHHLQTGLIDLNAHFDSIETTGLFLNSSHGIGADYAQSGPSGPSIFPATSLGINYQLNVNEDVFWQFAVFDAQPGTREDPMKNTIKLDSEDGALISTEVNIYSGELRYGFGAWQYTKNTDFIDGTGAAKNHGFYGIVEKPASESENNLAWWFRAGTAQKSINEIGEYIGGGITLNNFSGDDILGFAFASALASDAVSNDRAFEKHETTLELSYSIQINPWLRLQPDIQYVINPGISSEIDSATIIMLRAEINLMEF